jgi:uracil phosphoribosyltransferase
MTLKTEEKKTEENLIDKPYAYHKPSAEGAVAINRLRAAFSFVEREIQACCPDSRQKSIAITNNEQTAMWAIKAVVFNDPKSEVDLKR